MSLRAARSTDRFFALAARLTLTLALILGAAQASRGASIPINILPLGDSNTAANRGFYIPPLLDMLTANGYAPSYLANEGHSGFIIDGSMAGAPRTGLRENIGVGRLPDFLDHPHVNEANTFILLMIGTNDIDTNYLLDTASVQSRMTGLLTAIRAEAPLAQVIVATVPPIIGSEIPTKKFNADIAAISVGPHISLIDIYGAFPADYSAYMADRLHPNQAGGNLMAPVFFNGIRAVPEPSSGLLALVAAAALLIFGLSQRR